MLRLMLTMLVWVPAICAQADNSRLDGRFVTDPLTGVALGSFDAISYFTEPEPLVGRSDFEHYWQGVSWYFATAANRDAFAHAPEVYAPQYGGYGTMSMARGFLSEGNPQIYEIMDNRLYLFYSPGNREAFLRADKMSRRDAMEKWKVLEASVPRP